MIPLSRREGKPPKLEVPAVLIADAAHDDMTRLNGLALQGEPWRIIWLLDGNRRIPAKLTDHVFAVLPRKVSSVVLQKTVERAFENLQAQEERRRTRQRLQRAVSDLETLNKIGVALSTERNTDALLELILSKSREVTTCDAGSLYLVEAEPDGGKHLVFKLTQSDSHSVPFRQFKLPIDRRSIAGYAAATGQVLNIRDAYRIRNLPFRLNRDFDEQFGYRTKSMLVLPMKNQKDEVIGVLQLINAKRRAAARLSSPKLVQEEVVPFSQRSQELAASLASQAAVALENNLLYRDIQRLFDSFVDASVKAIESRDPTTFGHSERVARLTVELARTVDRCDTGLYKDVHFTDQDIREIEYASRLHDFGKIGVREEVLVKAKKLYEPQLELVKKRFLYIRKVLEFEACRKKLDHLLDHGNQNFADFFAQVEGELASQVRNLDEFLEHILRANEPAVLPEKISEKLTEIAGWSFQDPSGPAEPLLTQQELELLSIPKGSLNVDERLQIESHVIHSFMFLSQIPWTKELRRIPEIARAHHEKLDGSGYPYRMKGKEIPVQARMMTIADMFDALTARDRPYKKAVPVNYALKIIGEEVQSQLLDPVLFRLFVDARLYELTSRD